MADPDLQHMMQTTLALPGILHSHAEHSAEEVMGGLMRLVTQLEAAREAVVLALRNKAPVDEIYTAIMATNPLASRYHAEDLLAVSGNIFTSFTPLLGHDKTTLTPAASADVMIWLRVLDQTLVAARLLFQTARLYGRAPNGKRLGETG